MNFFATMNFGSVYIFLIMQYKQSVQKRINLKLCRILVFCKVRGRKIILCPQLKPIGPPHQSIQTAFILQSSANENKQSTKYRWPIFTIFRRKAIWLLPVVQTVFYRPFFQLQVLAQYRAYRIVPISFVWIFLH